LRNPEEKSTRQWEEHDAPTPDAEVPMLSGWVKSGIVSNAEGILNKKIT